MWHIFYKSVVCERTAVRTFRDIELAHAFIGTLMFVGASAALARIISLL